MGSCAHQHSQQELGTMAKYAFRTVRAHGVIWCLLNPTAAIEEFRSHVFWADLLF
jgi:hypothetical protein